MLKEGRCRWNIAFSCYSEGLAAGQGSIESLKFVDSSGLALMGVYTNYLFVFSFSALAFMR